jgi:hypothetical protein
MLMYEAHEKEEEDQNEMVINLEKVTANRVKENHRWTISVRELMLLSVVNLLVIDNLDWTVWPLITFVERPLNQNVALVQDERFFLAYDER